jgi:molybdopterin-guanine dinucleotide biosynthesis protein A
MATRASGIILAGGQSRRMGRDKAFLSVGGVPLIERVIGALTRITSDLILVTNAPEEYAHLGTRLTRDWIPGTGPLGGIYSGLRMAENPLAIAVSCDLPFLDPDLLRYQLALAEQFDVVIPSVPDPSKPPAPRGRQPTAKDTDLHPLHAVYSKNCLEPMRVRIAAGDFRLIGFHDAVRVRVVTQEEVDRFDPQHQSFFNVNTPEDLEFAESTDQKRIRSGDESH